MGDPLKIKVDGTTVGVALLVSNDYESLESVNSLSCTAQDTKNLEKLFKEFGYVVYKKHNVSKREFRSYCKELSDFEYPPTCERLVVYFSGHGSDGLLLMRDGTDLDIKDIITKFQPFMCDNDRIGLMARMFFFDSCRGDKKDRGFDTTKLRTSNLGKEFKCLERVPKEGNVLVAYACTPNYVSLVGSNGSRWTNCLVEALEKSTETDSLGTVLTMANGLLSKNYTYGIFQTATFTSSLQGGVFLKKEANERVKRYKAPRSLSVNHATDTTMDLSWMIPDMSDGKIIEYELQFSPVVTYIKKSGELKAKVSRLSPGTEYQFKVAAVTTEGHGPFSDILPYNTTNEPPQPTLNPPAKEEFLAVTFNNKSAAENLWRESAKLQSLSYEKMRDQLEAMGVITYDEQKSIDSFDQEYSKMTEVLSIVITDLQKGKTEKYEGFLKVMKESDDESLKEIARKLENKANATLRAKEVLKKYYGRLITELPLDDKIFSSQLQRADLLPLDAAACMQAKSTNAEKASYFLSHVLEPGADVYFSKLLTIMKESGSPSLESLADDIERTSTGKIFNCSDAAKLLKSTYTMLLNLSYSNMSDSLYANDVITQQEKLEIQQLIGKSQMERVLDIVIVSLNVNQTAKYKGFLLAMESSDDRILNEMARKLGGSASVPG